MTAIVTANGNAISGAAVTWSGNNDDVATISSNGTVTLIAPGTVTFTASYAGVDGEYASSSGTYEMTVTSSAPYVQPTEVTINMNYSWLGSGNGSNISSNDLPVETKLDVLTQYTQTQLMRNDSTERVNNLFNEGVVTAQRRDEAQAAVEATSAQVKAAQSQYDMARNGARQEEKKASSAQVNQASGAIMEVNSYLNETVQVAQMDGEVSEVYPKVGELVGTGTPIMTVSMMDDQWATFNIREDQLKGMTVGSEITVSVPALEKELKMKVFYMKDKGSFAVWKATKANGQYDQKTFEVKARPLKKIEGVRPGMSVILKQKEEKKE